MSKSRIDPEIQQVIHQRYEDTSEVIFKQNRKRATECPLLTIGESAKHYSYSSFGNAAVVMRKSGRSVTKKDERPIQSVTCTII